MLVRHPVVIYRMISVRHRQKYTIILTDIVNSAVCEICSIALLSLPNDEETEALLDMRWQECILLYPESCYTGAFYVHIHIA